MQLDHQQTKYMYNDHETHPVEEYIFDQGEFNREGGNVIPLFVLTVKWPRVVQFYMPNSKICQEFKGIYVELAREIRRLSTRIPVSFHAVSCLANKQLCSDLGIEGVPYILSYLMGSTHGAVLKRREDNSIDINYVANELQITLDDNELKTNRNDGTTDNANKDVPDVFKDAEQSFIYSLQIIQTFKKFSSFKSDIFLEWIDLLHWSLPSRWNLHNLINDIRNNYNSVSENPSQLQIILQSHQTSTAKWSESCATKNYLIGHAGYNCGLWKLFHIVSIGVSEQHDRVLGGKERLSTFHAAETMRNFIENFLIDCETCQIHFRQTYDTCFTSKKYECASFLTKDISQLSIKWKELSLWVWYMHNEVNIKRRLSNYDANLRSNNHLLWPQPHLCPKCRANDAEWNLNEVNIYLHDYYWPKGISNPRFVVLDRRKENYDEANHHNVNIYFVLFSWAVFFSLFVFLGKKLLKNCRFIGLKKLFVSFKNFTLSRTKKNVPRSRGQIDPFRLRMTRR